MPLYIVICILKMVKIFPKILVKDRPLVIEFERGGESPGSGFKSGPTALDFGVFSTTLPKQIDQSSLKVLSYLIP